MGDCVQIGPCLQAWFCFFQITIDDNIILSYNVLVVLQFALCSILCKVHVHTQIYIYMTPATSSTLQVSLHSLRSYLILDRLFIDLYSLLFAVCTSRSLISPFL
jgi:hypothetical protein